MQTGGILKKTLLLPKLVVIPLSYGYIIEVLRFLKHYISPYSIFGIILSNKNIIDCLHIENNRFIFLIFNIFKITI